MIVDIILVTASVLLATFLVVGYIAIKQIKKKKEMFNKNQ